MDLLIKRKSDGEIFKVRKYIKAEMPDLEESVWSNDWYGRHVIGSDCEWANDSTSEKDLTGMQSYCQCWVSVTEQLPNHRQKVLFCTRSDVHKALYMEKMSNEHGDFNKVFLSNDGGHYELEMQIITHWMPLPELPN